MELIDKGKIVVPDWGWHYEDDVHFGARLSVSLRRFGQMVPLVVRQIHGGKYEIVDGRRRWEAMKNAPGSEVWVHNIGSVSRAMAVKHYLALSLSAVTDYAALAKHVTDEIPEDDYGVLPTFTPFSAERYLCLLYTSPSPRDRQKSRMPSSA